MPTRQFSATILGGVWPLTDPSSCTNLADTQRQKAEGLLGCADETRTVADDVTASQSGATIDAFHRTAYELAATFTKQADHYFAMARVSDEVGRLIYGLRQDLDKIDSDADQQIQELQKKAKGLLAAIVGVEIMAVIAKAKTDAAAKAAAASTKITAEGAKIGLGGTPTPKSSGQEVKSSPDDVILPDSKPRYGGTKHGDLQTQGPAGINDRSAVHQAKWATDSSPGQHLADDLHGSGTPTETPADGLPASPGQHRNSNLNGTGRGSGDANGTDAKAGNASQVTGEGAAPGDQRHDSFANDNSSPGFSPTTIPQMPNLGGSSSGGAGGGSPLSSMGNALGGLKMPGGGMPSGLPGGGLPGGGLPGGGLPGGGLPGGGLPGGGLPGAGGPPNPVQAFGQGLGQGLGAVGGGGAAIPASALTPPVAEAPPAVPHPAAAAPTAVSPAAGAPPATPAAAPVAGGGMPGGIPMGGMGAMGGPGGGAPSPGSLPPYGSDIPRTPSAPVSAASGPAAPAATGAAGGAPGSSVAPLPPGVVGSGVGTSAGAAAEAIRSSLPDPLLTSATELLHQLLHDSRMYPYMDWCVGVFTTPTGPQTVIVNSEGSGYLPQGVYIPRTARMLFADAGLPAEFRSRWFSWANPAETMLGYAALASASRPDIELHALVVSTDDGGSSIPARAVIEHYDECSRAQSPIGDTAPTTSLDDNHIHRLESLDRALYTRLTGYGDGPRPDRSEAWRTTTDAANRALARAGALPDVAVPPVIRAVLEHLGQGQPVPDAAWLDLQTAHITELMSAAGARPGRLIGDTGASAHVLAYHDLTRLIELLLLWRLDEMAYPEIAYLAAQIQLTPAAH